jgi:sugar-specific transcriptional regulator TrmB
MESMRYLLKELSEKNKRDASLLQLSMSKINVLASFGLSKDEISLYDLMLFLQREVTAQDIATHAAVFPSACYRLFYSLETYGLVKQQAIRPKSYIAIQPKIAFPIAAEIHRIDIEKKLENLRFMDTIQHSPAEILIGRQALYKRYVLELSKTKKNMDAHSIGIAYSDEMYREHVLAHKRGVKMRYAFQQYKPENFPILRKWKHVGIELRHFKSDRGFHLMIFDNDKVLMSFSNPDNTEDRLSIFTDNETATKIFGFYFESIWVSARSVNLGES